jgi:hypothetical protein
VLRNALSVPSGARASGKPPRGRSVPSGARASGKPPRGRSVLSGARASGKPPRGRSVLSGARASGKPPRGGLAIAAAAAACALAACGPVQMGAAAISGGQRISTAELTAQVANLQHALDNSSGKVPVQFKQSQEAQEVLAWMLRFQVRDEMAVRNNVVVTTAQSQRALASIAAQARQGSANVPLTELAAANGLPPDMLPDLGRYQAIQDQIVSQLDGGTLPSGQSGLQALGQKFSHEQCVAAKSLDIKVNPQFGQLDYSQLSVVPATTTLAAPETPSPSPTTKPQLTPPC